MQQQLCKHIKSYTIAHHGLCVQFMADAARLFERVLAPVLPCNWLMSVPLIGILVCAASFCGAQHWDKALWRAHWKK